MSHKIRWVQTDKQAKAWGYLTDTQSTEVLFGGGAGGAKSFLGCCWLIVSCTKYPGTRWLMGRAVLKRLKETTLQTFFEVCHLWGLIEGKDYKYNSIEGIITFSNRSTILLKDLKLYPSDPNFDELGSLEITGAFVDEANQITSKAKNIVMSRIRYKLDENDLVPKMLYTCNPAKNWVYSDFYKPSRDGELSCDKKFVQALASDNPFISKHYIENLKKLDKNSRERLLNGNWEYDDDPSKLMDYDSICDIFTNHVEPSDEKFISCDVARLGEDKTVICYWEGLKCVKIEMYAKTRVDETIDLLEKCREKYGVPMSHVVIDEDGVGGGVVDGLRGSKGFVNNSKAISPNKKNPVNYANLKTQCYFEFARLVNEGKICIGDVSVDVKEKIIEELEQVKQNNIDKDAKISLVSKETIKQSIGRSPDVTDALMMRMYFEIKKQPILTPIFI